MADAFKAGVGVIDITPPLGTGLTGYLNFRASAHVHDPLRVKCIVLDNGQERIAIAVCDLIAIAKEQVDEARHLINGHTGIPMTHILVAAVHTHSGPPVGTGLFQVEPDRKYLETLPVRIADGVRCAVNNLQPARIGWGAGHESSVVFNRRYHMKPGTVPPNPFGGIDKVKMNPGVRNPNIVGPAGPIDPQIGLLSIQYDDGRPMALLGNYALHYVGGNPPLDISADYFGMWCEEMARLADIPGGEADRERPPFLAILTNGCSGDINNIDVRGEKRQSYPYHQMRKVARIVAAESYKAWQRIEHHDWVPLAARETLLTLGVRKPSPAEVEEARRKLAGTGPNLEEMAQVYARETVLLNEWPDTMQCAVQAMRIGGLGIVTFPGEAFCELGLAVKKASPFETMLCIELANGYHGYIPTAEAHEAGGYETWRARSSCLEKLAAPKMVAAGVEMLKALAATGPAPTRPA